MRQAVIDNVEPGSLIYSDGHSAYLSLPRYRFSHEWVNHSAGEYVRDQVTTNGIESFWALLKRGYTGIFHCMSWDHMHRYVDEFVYRYNIGPGNGFKTIANTFLRMVGERLTYARLVALGRIRREQLKPVRAREWGEPAPA